MAKDRSTIVRQMGGDNRRRNPFEGLESQIQAEYNLAWKHQKPKKDEAEIRLKLYNNQKRDKEAVGDTTMFSIFQTVLASLYDDRLSATFEGKEEGDEEVAENLNVLAESDYYDMRKDIVDFEWDWDTLFFGRGLLGLDEFIREPDKNIFIPVPRVLDPIPFLRDPFATSMNGDLLGRGGARFYGGEEKFTEKDLEDNSHIFDDIDYKEINYGSGTMSLLQDAVTARDTAQNNQTQLQNEKERSLGANSQFNITVWNTFYKNPKTDQVKRVKVWLANDRSKVIGLKFLDTDYWPVVDRPLFPHSHDWDGTSIPDLTEDKQRARAVAQNLAIKAMKADLYPSYIYDSNKIVNRKDLRFNFNKFIPVDAKGSSTADAITPLMKARPNMQLLDFVLNALDVSAQKATATPDIQQGIQSEKDRPLGETNILASRVDTRYSLSAKVFGWSEKTFWNYWYQMYKKNFADDIDEKVLRVAGAFGPKWRTLGKKNIITERFDPDITIESKNVSRAKQIEERQGLTVYFSQIKMDPTVNIRYANKKLGELYGLKRDELDRLFPQTVDERIAEEENISLNKNVPAEVKAEDDHNVHLEIHSKANPTNATMAHIKTHEKALSIKKVHPGLFPQDPMQQGVQGPDGQPMPAPTQPTVETLPQAPVA